MINLSEISKGISPLNKEAMELAAARQNSLVKPMGSLGRLEDISIQLSGITGELRQDIDKKILFLFAADNGVYEQGIAASPQNLTNLLLSFYGADMGCAINIICRHNNVELKLIDIGVIGELDYTNIINERLMSGTKNFYNEPAMSPEIVLNAVEIGIKYAKYASDNGYKLIGNGEVGMGNTTTAAACIMAALGINDSEIAVGRGAGLTDEAFENKKRVVEHGLLLHKPKRDDIIDILSKVGGLDIASLVGLYIGAAYYKIPIIIDGVISISAALLAFTFNPLTKDYMIPSHISKEPAYALASDKMGLNPMLNLGMRLGEGTGCPLAMGIIENAVAIMNTMNTFDEVSVEKEYRKTLKV